MGSASNATHPCQPHRFTLLDDERGTVAWPDDEPTESGGAHARAAVPVDYAAFMRDASAYFEQQYAFPPSEDAPVNPKHAEARGRAETEDELRQIDLALAYRHAFERALRAAYRTAAEREGHQDVRDEL